MVLKDSFLTNFFCDRQSIVRNIFPDQVLSGTDPVSALHGAGLYRARIMLCHA